MSKDPFARQAAKLADLSRAVLVQASASPESSETQAWEEAAEDCVLARVDAIRILGGLPMHQPELDCRDRRTRLETLLGYWANGCPFVIDEKLFADILKRRRPRPVSTQISS
ncbi:hypothetical protein [Roseibium polysiphoniae]|uniref:Uncharacterized protein n=1 Tax=Roseibium polysiphoniae TaxID=2571221 RepID=A0ABR9CDV5_9HYPH|nr:hypothetical protein [Roseibium polysiphoniae]MBD8878071.1 hypothetical protein [Roseibium polysiphoniae]